MDNSTSGLGERNGITTPMGYNVELRKLDLARD